MRPTPADISGILGTLARTPARIERACAVIGEPALWARADPRTWSAHDILAHLRACRDLWGASIEAMPGEDGATQQPISPRAYLRKTTYLDQDTRTSLEAFATQREALLARLHDLAPAAWSRSTVIDGRTHTGFTQARRTALHEDTHCAQIEDTLRGATT